MTSSITKNNVNTWSAEMNYENLFLERIKTLFSYIDTSKINSIMDLGCGNQWAREILPSNIEYIPVDAIKHASTTIVKDFNNGEFFDKKVDLSLCSGLFEYIYDVKSLIEKICKNSNYVLASYHFAENSKIRHDIWVSSLSGKEFIEIFNANGFVLDVKKQTHLHENGESYMLFSRKELSNTIVFVGEGAA